MLSVEKTLHTTCTNCNRHSSRRQILLVFFSPRAPRNTPERPFFFFFSQHPKMGFYLAPRLPFSVIPYIAVHDTADGGFLHAKQFFATCLRVCMPRRPSLFGERARDFRCCCWVGQTSYFACKYETPPPPPTPRARAPLPRPNMGYT